MNPFAARPASMHSFLSGEARTSTRARLPALLLVLLLLALACGSARATCQYTQGGATTVTFSPPSTITLPVNTPNGTVIYTSPQVSPANPPVVTCGYVGSFYFGFPETLTYGVNNLIGSQPSTSENTYPTNVPGISYRITHGDSTTYLYPYPCCSQSVSQTQFSVTSSLQLVKTGTITPGSTLPAGNFAAWTWQYLTPETFSLGNSVTFAQPACQVNNPNIVVTLPSVALTAFSGVNSTTGTTGFAINLTCSSGAHLRISLDSSTTLNANQGTIQDTGGSGHVTDIGVQILDDKGHPVHLGNSQNEGTTPDGTLTLPYSAQYIQTGNNPAAGTLTATATFTLSYQ